MTEDCTSYVARVKSKVKQSYPRSRLGRPPATVWLEGLGKLKVEEGGVQ
jgi:hypothetical protein